LRSYSSRLPVAWVSRNISTMPIAMITAKATNMPQRKARELRSG